MIINDRVYGTVKIDEPVLLELINSKPIQRLKGINQAGAAQYTIKGKNVSRYEHSLGVMILLKKLNASIEEQIAGLLHDIPHTAFSHVIDFAFPSKDHDFHEKFHEKIINESEIPNILKKHGIDTNKILDKHNFPLLEKKLPDLCADRIDYTLRDITAVYGNLTDLQSKSAIEIHKKITRYISTLIVYKNEIIFSNKDMAKEFAEDFIKFDEESWSHPIEVTLFQLLADAMKLGLDSGILTEQDLFQNDEFVYNKLKNSNNQQILKKLEMISPNLEIIDNPNDHDFFSKNKLRYVDPKFIIMTKLQSNEARDTTLQTKRVSEEFPDFLEFMNKHIEKIEKGNFIKIKKW
ncbi:MAG: HD domain-containing protein [Candidatus Aenigmatarchaeota archaeon]